MTELLWIFVAGLVAALVLQGVMLRRVFRRKLVHQQVVLRRTQHALNSKLEKTKSQIGQLQNDLSAARSQLKRQARQTTPAVPSAPSKQDLERELDNATAARRALPVDGFADTQPTHFGSLLLQ